MRKERRTTIGKNKFPKHKQINKLRTNKVKYCPLVANLLFKTNGKVKKPIIRNLMIFLKNFEKLQCRLVSKMWNDCVEADLPFLKEENFMTNLPSKINIKNSYKNEYRKSLSGETTRNSLNCSGFLNQSNEIFSKKRVLVKYINSKNFQTLKNKTELTELSRPKLLSQI
jgi:hypothetical protein